MSLKNLENLAKIGKLKREANSQSEFFGLLQSAKARFQDANRINLSIESRFDLAYNAAHSLALAALRFHGYRPDNQAGHRIIVFGTIHHTTQLPLTIGQILENCHRIRNLAEYEGFIDISEQLLKDLLSATEQLLEKVESL